MRSKVKSKNFDVLGYRTEKISTELYTAMTSFNLKTRILEKFKKSSWCQSFKFAHGDATVVKLLKTHAHTHTHTHTMGISI